MPNPNTLHTPKDALAAMKHKGHALRFVRDQTPAICLAAVKQYGHALQFVRDDAMYDRLASK